MECIRKIDLQVTCGPHVHACVWCALKRGGKETEGGSVDVPFQFQSSNNGCRQSFRILLGRSCSNGFSGAATKLATMAAIVSSAVS